MDISDFEEAAGAQFSSLLSWKGRDDEKDDDNKGPETRIENVQPPRRPPGKPSNKIRSWTLEILTLVGAILSEGSIFAVLFYMNDNALSKWPVQNQITLNAAISVFSTLFKSLLLVSVASCIIQAKWTHFKQPRTMYDMHRYDRATRSAKGSLLLLLNNRPFWSLASIGAIIMVFSVLLDAATQQLIEFRSDSVRIVDENQGGMLSLSTVYDTGAKKNNLGRFDYHTFDMRMQAAAINGLSGFLTPMNFECTLSECRWNDNEIYTTLGFGSNCKNVTSISTEDCGFPNVTISTPNVGKTCNVTTPGNNTIGWFYSQSSTRTDIVITSKPSVGINTYYEPTDVVSNPTNLLNFAMFRMYGNKNDQVDFLPWDLIECSIDLVGYKYSGMSVKNSSLQIEDIRRLALQKGIARGTYLGSMIDFTSVEGNHTFVANSLDLQIVRTYLKSNIFDGELESGDTDQSMSVPLGPLLLRSRNITAAVSMMAQSMTNVISQSDNSTNIYGDAFEQQPIVHVRWLYFALPGLLLLITAILLFSTISKAKRSKPVVWKISGTEMLAHQIVNWHNQNAEEIGNTVVDASARQLKIMLADDMTFQISP
ncbi:hypothetical protein BT63DRAFT_454290 [Microthyrium microscopicum]|uniref:Uncharacterized protein n=1 Tax=Microthyrium microscopicum TaxID=703497 RepID=A0A6A6UE71_9PEZI|nr:hypothetical protein BT63DRAFT_454290 [Microthyrium microscopicum]